MKPNDDLRDTCVDLRDELFRNRSLIIAANRGPVTFQTAEDGSRTFTRGSGGLVTALAGLAQHVDALWVACARTDTDIEWQEGHVSLWQSPETIQVRFLSPEPAAYDAYYNVIANPLLWFLHHQMWDIPRQPVIDITTWRAWTEGYVAVNRLYADAIVEQARTAAKRPLVMLQDYHLYLAPRMIRLALRPAERPTLLHFVHIPWPGPDYWSILPRDMRIPILEGLLGTDLLGFQTQDDVLNFLRTCERNLSRVSVRYSTQRVWYKNHHTQVRAFPISIDVAALKRLAATERVRAFRTEIENLIGDRKMLLRIERIEPSKNVVRGFQAYGEMLELFPELRGQVKFLAILVPSRMDLGEYRNYLSEIMTAVGNVNAIYGSSDWEPIRVLLGEDYERAVAAMQCYDVLLVNSIADGMNLVAKEGPIVNDRAGQLVLSERTGAREQLQDGSLVIAPCDVHATAHALRRALTMPEDEKERRAALLRERVEREDINWWLCQQLEAVARM